MSARPRKKKKETKARSAARRPPNVNGPLVWFGKDGSGVDYSLPATAIAVGDFTFVQHLHAADVQGFVYEFVVGAGAPPPFVGLICGNPQAARAAFDIFHSWSEGTDGDALQLTWCFQPNGTYAVFLTPDEARLAVRCLGFERFLRPLLFTAAFCKQVDLVDSTSDATHRFRDYCKSWHHPFLFGAVAIEPTLRVASVVTPLLKYQARIVDEAQLPEDSIERRMLSRRARQSKSAGLSPMEKPSVLCRDRVLEQHFPVTLERIRRSPVSHAIRTVASDGFGPSLAKQAAANLVLSARLCDGLPHFKGLAKSALRDTVVQGVSAHFEAADSSDISRLLSYENLSRQAMLDGNALLTAAGSKQGRTNQEVLALIEKKGLLDA